MNILSIWVNNVYTIIGVFWEGEFCNYLSAFFMPLKMFIFLFSKFRKIALKSRKSARHS